MRASLPIIRKTPAPKDFNSGMEEFFALAQKAVGAHDATRVMLEEMRRLHTDIKATLSSIRQGPQGPKGERGADAPAPDHNAIAELVTRKIRFPKDGKDGRPGYDGKSVSLDEILEALKENGLKVEHIKGLREEIDSYRNQLAGAAYGKDTSIRGGGDTVEAGTGITIAYNKTTGKQTITNTSASVTTVVGEDLSSQAPGMSFTLAHTPTSGTLRLYRGGARQNAGAGNDYTLSGTTITFNTTVASGEIILADYTY